MAKKGPKTPRGIERKLLTGDGRKKSPAEKLVDEAFGIRLAKRLGAENWSIYLEVEHEYDKTFKEVIK